MNTVLLLVVIAIVAFAAGRLSMKPAAPAPAKFGLDEAEAVKRALGGLSPDQAKVAIVAAAVGNMTLTLKEEAAELRNQLASAKSRALAAIREHRYQIAMEETNVAEVNNRDNEVTALTSAFGA